jgi:nitroreductase
MIDKDFILKAMHQSRKAQRNWSDKKVDQETIDFLTEIAVNAPSKQNEVDFNLTVITNEDMLKEHAARFTWGYHWKKTNSAMHNTQVHAPCIFIYGMTPAEDLHKDIWAADESGPGINELFDEEFGKTQQKSVGISSGQMVLAANMMGLRTGYSQNTMHNGDANPDEWRKWLGYEDIPRYEPIIVVGVGYPDESLAWYQTRDLEYLVAHEDETNLDTKPYLDIKSEDIRTFPIDDVFDFGPKSAKRDGTPIPKNVKVKRFF